MIPEASIGRPPLLRLSDSRYTEETVSISVAPGRQEQFLICSHTSFGLYRAALAPSPQVFNSSSAGTGDASADEATARSSATRVSILRQGELVTETQKDTIQMHRKKHHEMNEADRARR